MSLFLLFFVGNKAVVAVADMQVMNEPGVEHNPERNENLAVGA